MRKFLVLFLLFTVLAGAQAERPSVALVLGGGAARGFAHVIILELIEELGIPVDMVVGVSSGAIIGGLYAAGYSSAMIMEALNERDWTSFFTDRPASPFWDRGKQLPVAFSFGNSIGTIVPDWSGGYSTGQRAYELFKSLTVKIPSYLDFNELSIPFRAGTVEVPKGEFKLLDRGDLAEAIRASMSIQGIFEPFIIDGRNYVDGGIINNLPIREVHEMGYDIIIAVDLFAPPVEYSTTLLDLPELMLILYTNQMSIAQHELADVVLFPLPPDVSAADFTKGQEIYAMVREKREEMKALLEKAAELIIAGNPAHTGDDNTEKHNPTQIHRPVSTYEDIPPITAQRITIRGALARDNSFIEKEFSKHLKDKALDENNVTDFLESIYATGNYSMVIVRTDTPPGSEDTGLEIILYTMSEKKVLLRVGFENEGTFSSLSSTRSAMRSGVEFLWKDGSSLLIRMSALDELNFGLSLLRPLSPHFAVLAETDIFRDQDIIIDGVLGKKETAPHRLLFSRSAITGGFLVNRNNSFTLGPQFYLFMEQESSDPREDKTFFAIPEFNTAFTYSNLNNSLFPSRGIRVMLSNGLKFFPKEKQPFDLVSLDLVTMVPLGRWFSMGISGYGSSLFGDVGIPPDISTMSSEKAHRIFFPHAPPVIFSGEKKAAASLAFQFEPVENLSILGGRLLFLLAFSAGRAGSFEWNEWDNTREELIWNISFGSALVPIKNFGLILRAGAGGGDGLAPTPFVSIDIRLSRFQKNLF